MASSAGLDDDRDYAVDLLVRAYAAGELDVGDLEDRAERVLTAETTAALEDSIVDVGWPIPDRQDVLDREIAAWTAKGWEVAWAADTSASLVLSHRPNHLVHLAATVLTGGIWLIGWIAMTVGAVDERLHIEVDEFGNIDQRLVR